MKQAAAGRAADKPADKATAKPGDAPAGGKKNSKRLIIVALAALLLVGAGAAAFLLLGGRHDAAAVADTSKGADKGKEAAPPRPLFVEFEPFTTNTKDPDKFLQIKLTFQVKDDKALEGLKDLAPVVRSAVLPVLGAQDPAALMSPEGKEKLAADLAAAANKALVGTGIDNGVDAVLITHLIIQ